MLPESFPQRSYYLAVCLIVVAIVGIWIYKATIYITIRAIQYYRIMNEIRGYFVRKNVVMKSILLPLPLTRIDPKWSAQVFDPGIILVKMIISLSTAISAGIITDNICQTYEVLKAYLIYTDMTIIFIFFFILLHALNLYESHLREKKIDSNQLDYAFF
ncbi:MAG: hypothetical protein ABR985_12850 [Methanotrichaceae archaeon]